MPMQYDFSTFVDDDAKGGIDYSNDGSPLDSTYDRPTDTNLYKPGQVYRYRYLDSEHVGVIESVSPENEVVEIHRLDEMQQVDPNPHFVGYKSLLELEPTRLSTYKDRRQGDSPQLGAKNPAGDRPLNPSDQIVQRGKADDCDATSKYCKAMGYVIGAANARPTYDEQAAVASLLAFKAVEDSGDAVASGLERGDLVSYADNQNVLRYGRVYSVNVIPGMAEIKRTESDSVGNERQTNIVDRVGLANVKAIETYPSPVEKLSAALAEWVS